MGCSASEATGLGFVFFFCCYQSSCVVSQRSCLLWFQRFFNFTPGRADKEAAEAEKEFARQQVIIENIELEVDVDCVDVEGQRFFFLPPKEEISVGGGVNIM